MLHVWFSVLTYYPLLLSCSQIYRTTLALPLPFKIPLIFNFSLCIFLYLFPDFSLVSLSLYSMHYSLPQVPFCFCYWTTPFSFPFFLVILYICVNTFIICCIKMSCLLSVDTSWCFQFTSVKASKQFSHTSKIFFSIITPMFAMCSSSLSPHHRLHLRNHMVTLTQGAIKFHSLNVIWVLSKISFFLLTHVFPLICWIHGLSVARSINLFPHDCISSCIQHFPVNIYS